MDDHSSGSEAPVEQASDTRHPRHSTLGALPAAPTESTSAGSPDVSPTPSRQTQPPVVVEPPTPLPPTPMKVPPTKPAMDSDAMTALLARMQQHEEAMAQRAQQMESAMAQQTDRLVQAMQRHAGLTSSSHEPSNDQLLGPGAVFNPAGRPRRSILRTSASPPTRGLDAGQRRSLRGSISDQQLATAMSSVLPGGVSGASAKAGPNARSTTPQLPNLTAHNALVTFVANGPPSADASAAASAIGKPFASRSEHDRSGSDPGMVRSSLEAGDSLRELAVSSRNPEPARTTPERKGSDGHTSGSTPPNVTPPGAKSRGIKFADREDIVEIDAVAAAAVVGAQGITRRKRYPRHSIQSDEVPQKGRGIGRFRAAVSRTSAAAAFNDAGASVSNAPRVPRTHASVFVKDGQDKAPGRAKSVHSLAGRTDDEEATMQMSVMSKRQTLFGEGFHFETDYDMLHSLAPNHKEDGEAPDSPRNREDALKSAINAHKNSIKPGGVSETESYVAISDIAYVIVALIACCMAATVVTPRIDFSPWAWGCVIALEVLISIFSCAWVALRFFVRARTGEWDVLDTLPAIRQHYLRSWFAVDLCTALPVDLVFLGWADPVFSFLQLRHLLRFVRIVQLGRSGNPLLESRRWFRFLSVCTVMVLFMHIFACIFYQLEDHTSYADSLYWSVATMTSVGYGDVSPLSIAGKLYACVAMLFGILLISTMTAFATSFLTSRDKLTEAINDKKQLMHSMLTHYDIPWEVQREVITMFPAVVDAQNEEQFKLAAQALPTFVCERIEAYTRAKMLRFVPLFQSLTREDIVKYLTHRLQQRFIPPSELVIVAGDTGEEMFFLVRGVVEVLVPIPGSDEDIVVACLRSGTFFGELALIDHGSKRAASVLAVTLCELLALTKTDFDSLCEERPDIEDAVKVEAQRRQQLNPLLVEHAQQEDGDEDLRSDQSLDAEPTPVIAVKKSSGQAPESPPDGLRRVLSVRRRSDEAGERTQPAAADSVSTLFQRSSAGAGSDHDASVFGPVVPGTAETPANGHDIA